MFNLFKKNFDTTLLKPIEGFLTGTWFSNPSLNIPTTLFFNINITLEDFNYKNQNQQTYISFEFIELPIKSYNELQNNTYNFPINPENGYIDGSIYINGSHNPIDVIEISFSKTAKNFIYAHFKAIISFEDNSIKQTEFEFDTKINFGDIHIDCEMLASKPIDDLQQFVKDHFNMQNFSYCTDSGIFLYNKQ